MNIQQKVKEIKKIKKNLQAEMPRVLKEVEVYEKALYKGALKQNPVKVCYSYLEKT